MGRISIKHDLDRVIRDLDLVATKQVPFATKLALNSLAETTKRKVESDISSKLDRPTNYSLNMMRVRYANTRNLTSEVMVKDSAMVTKRGMRGPDRVLGHLFSAGLNGGSREGKGMEGLLVSAGIMPRGMYVVPGSGAKLDGNGNIDRSLIIQLLSYFRAFRESGFKANMTDKSRAAFEKRTARKIGGASSSQFFVVKHKKLNGLHPGIWQRAGFLLDGGNGRGVMSSAIRPILLFVNKVRYRTYFDLNYVTQSVVRRDFNSEFKKAMDYAIQTSRTNT